MTYAPMADAAQTKLLDFTPEVHPEHVQEFMVMNNGEIRQRRGKLPEEALPPGVATHAPNRELLEVTTMTVAPTSVTMHRDFQTRIASPEEQAWIDKFVETHNQGRPYRMTGKNQFTEMPKENCDHDYFCGRMRFFDEDGKMIHETPAVIGTLSAGQGASNMPGVPSGHDPEAGFSHFFHPESTFSGHGAEEYWGQTIMLEDLLHKYLLTKTSEIIN
ncbi:hypothetical protein KEM48_011049 [Puccinia striiformis f. sp. tritici PST-130]|nr:hypothetical protein KEM48_011049 [Puccinia striiformis f. sp. tritici PST-130]